MKQYWCAVLTSFVLFFVASSYAQLGRMPLKANIPFPFRVGDLEMPAGQYTIRQMDESGSLAVVGSGSATKIVGSMAVQAAASPKVTKFVFHSYQGTYFLSQVWLRGQARGRELRPTQFETELANQRRPQFVAIRAGK